MIDHPRVVRLHVRHLGRHAEAALPHFLEPASSFAPPQYDRLLLVITNGEDVIKFNMPREDVPKFIRLLSE
jgi:hypothetical protein